MNTREEEIKAQLNVLRQKIVELYAARGKVDPEILRLSQEADGLINEYHGLQEGVEPSSQP
jgi:uncharacterized coiled-coil DUF342 family protein